MTTLTPVSTGQRQARQRNKPTSDSAQPTADGDQHRKDSDSPHLSGGMGDRKPIPDQDAKNDSAPPAKVVDLDTLSSDPALTTADVDPASSNAAAATDNEDHVRFEPTPFGTQRVLFGPEPVW